MQAFVSGHSGSVTHSGRQFGGAPFISGKHEQLALPLLILHIEFGPHGEGRHLLSCVIALNEYMIWQTLVML
jgi:hypothetical protein